MKFKHNPLNSLKLVITSMLLSVLLSGCFYMNIDGSNDFDRMVNSMVESSYRKLKMNIEKDEVVLVSDFVNIDKLENKSKLGFLLSETLKDILSNQNIIIREVELTKDFRIGQHGFNVLSRDDKKIDNKIYNERFAVVGTYSITNKRLRIFIKLIDIYTGHILSSASASTITNSEIEKLDFVPKENSYNIYQPMVL
ncbi:MAG: FlgO family outer membrane protein [Candidatus Marinarcus sp.]|uniref:FlgO family outer membrane protein n=1 Tax=Candidatus Marinarcus sp. TaxID=3100987 RepID=UPI003AFFBBA9